MEWPLRVAGAAEESTRGQVSLLTCPCPPAWHVFLGRQADTPKGRGHRGPGGIGLCCCPRAHATPHPLGKAAVSLQGSPSPSSHPPVTMATLLGSPNLSAQSQAHCPPGWPVQGEGARGQDPPPGSEKQQIWGLFSWPLTGQRMPLAASSTPG